MFEALHQLALPLALRFPGAQLPFHRFSCDAKRLEELQIFVLDVRGRRGRDAPVGEEPVQVACPGVIVAQSQWRPRERGDHASLEVVLQPQREVEVAAPQLTADIEEGPPPMAPVEYDYLVHGRVSADERGGTRLKHPGDVTRRIVPLERVDHRENVHRVAHRTEHDDADASPDGERKGGWRR